MHRLVDGACDTVGEKGPQSGHAPEGEQGLQVDRIYIFHQIAITFHNMNIPLMICSLPVFKL